MLDGIDEKSWRTGTTKRELGRLSHYSTSSSFATGRLSRNGTPRCAVC